MKIKDTLIMLLDDDGYSIENGHRIFWWMVNIHIQYTTGPERGWSGNGRLARVIFFLIFHIFGCCCFVLLYLLLQYSFFSSFASHVECSISVSPRIHTHLIYPIPFFANFYFVFAKKKINL